MEIGHNMGLMHPSNDDPANNPTDGTCMYSGRMTHVDYGIHQFARARDCGTCPEHTIAYNDEWFYIPEYSYGGV